MAAGQLHAALRHERLQQHVHLRHQALFGGKPVGAVFLDGADARLLDVAGDDAGKRPPQVGGQIVDR